MPIALRLHLAADPDLCRDVASAFIDAVFASYVRGARAAGALDALGSFAHPGAVNFDQRLGSNSGLNVHLHLLALDGVYVTDGPGRAPTFHAAPTLTDIEVARVHHDARQRIERVLRARGLLCQPGEEPLPVKGMDESLLPLLQAASTEAITSTSPSRLEVAEAETADLTAGVDRVRGARSRGPCCGKGREASRPRFA